MNPFLNGCMLTPGHGLGKHFWQETITTRNSGFRSTRKPRARMISNEGSRPRSGSGLDRNRARQISAFAAYGLQANAVIAGGGIGPDGNLEADDRIRCREFLGR